MIETTVDAVEVAAPPTVSPETDVANAADSLRDPDAPAIPVLNDAEAVVGIVTESDVVAMVAETADRPSVGTIMSTPVTTIAPTATLSEAAEAMRIAGVRHLPVIADGTYLGVLSAATLAPYLTRSELAIEWDGAETRIDDVDDAEGSTRSASD